MIKVALLAATVLVAASTAMATNLAFESGAPPLSEASCHLVQSLDLGCALRIVLSPVFILCRGDITPYSACRHPSSG